MIRSRVCDMPCSGRRSTTAVQDGCHDHLFGTHRPATDSGPQRWVSHGASRIAGPLGHCLRLSEGCEPAVVRLVVGVDDAGCDSAVLGTVGTVVVDAVNLQSAGLLEAVVKYPVDVCISVGSPFAAHRDATLPVVRVHGILGVVATRDHPLPHPSNALTWARQAGMSTRRAFTSQDAVRVDRTADTAATTNEDVVAGQPVKYGPLSVNLAWLHLVQVLGAPQRAPRCQVGSEHSLRCSARTCSDRFPTRQDALNRPLSVRFSNSHLREYSHQEGGESTWG